MQCHVNVNEQVKVKLNEYGVRILLEQHIELNRELQSRGEFGLGRFILHTDSQGYATFKIWQLMSKFGNKLYAGAKMPFDSDIIIIAQEDE